ncbi:hypothetical protein [Flaviflexus huanghaiensis]|uniref:hypothetical protein n=1 Tax=Flaviflexus huanghaiensis TaxID=1111473 RepID=UPI0015FA6054|nr:hypothetical protein [Flaviflexus huanghaiensis]
MMTDVLVFYVPAENTADVINAVCKAGAGRVGDYEECAFITPGTGQFRPVRSANPAIGEVGELTTVKENRVEIVFPRDIREDVIEALVNTHPYEEPAFHIIRTS